jgi:hypothetical protein
VLSPRVQSGFLVVGGGRSLSAAVGGFVQGRSEHNIGPVSAPSLAHREVHL